MLLDPWFSAITGALSRGVPFVSAGSLRLGLLCLDTALVCAVMQLIAMSTFSLVGAVVPVAAAGSLFAGFMSVTNLGYTFSYASGAWLYANGMSVAPLRAVQDALFGIAGGAGDKLSLQMLVLIGVARLLHQLPRRAPAAGARGDARRRGRRRPPQGRNAGSPCRPGCAGRRTGARWRWARPCSPS